MLRLVVRVPRPSRERLAFLYGLLGLDREFVESHVSQAKGGFTLGKRSPKRGASLRVSCGKERRPAARPGLFCVGRCMYTAAMGATPVEPHGGYLCRLEEFDAGELIRLAREALLE